MCCYTLSCFLVSTFAFLAFERYLLSVAIKSATLAAGFCACFFCSALYKGTYVFWVMTWYPEWWFWELFNIQFRLVSHLKIYHLACGCCFSLWWVWLQNYTLRVLAVVFQVSLHVFELCFCLLTSSSDPSHCFVTQRRYTEIWAWWERLELFL